MVYSDTTLIISRLSVSPWHFNPPEFIKPTKINNNLVCQELVCVHKCIEKSVFISTLQKPKSLLQICVYIEGTM